MNRRLFLTRSLPASTALLLLPELTGCGSIFFPERIGQPRMGPLDWKVVALDGIGLLLFFIPGVVAFAVDIYNGTIFLPTYMAQMPPSQYVPPQTDESYLPPQPGENYLPPPQSGENLPPPPAGPLWPTPSPAAPAPQGAPPAGPQPLGSGSQRMPAAWDRAGFETIDVPPGELTRAGIERLVSKRIGQRVSLHHEQARVTSLGDLSEFGQRVSGLAAGEIEGLPPDRAFRRS